jgi:hypothetical protein
MKLDASRSSDKCWADMSLDIKGISYLTDDIPPEVVRSDLRVVREDLHCSTVMLIGADTREQIQAAHYALGAGLDV